MRVLCLDVGERRIGVAVSDALDLTAQGVETIWCKGVEHDVARVLELSRQYETDHILCGLPRNMDGSEGFQAQRVRAFAEHLTEKGLTVRFQDERMTTKLATGVLLEADVRRSRRREVVDKLAATYILQSFLDAGGWKDIPIKKKFLGGKYIMDENHEMDMEREDIIELVDEDGQEVSFVDAAASAVQQNDGRPQQAGDRRRHIQFPRAFPEYEPVGTRYKDDVGRHHKGRPGSSGVLDPHREKEKLHI